MPMKTLRTFLDDAGVNYTTIPHRLSYTARETAAVSRTPPIELAKTVIVKIDGEMAMAVLAASRHVDLSLLKSFTGAQHVSFAKESDFKSRFPDCEIGAMPPFGNLFGMRVYVDEGLMKDKEIAFNAGSHMELVRVSSSDFARLVKPTIVSFAFAPGVESVGAWHL